MIQLDEGRREEAIEAGWRAYQERVPDCRSAYLKACEGWKVIAVCDGECVIGAFFAKNGFVHIGIVPEYRGRWVSRRLIDEMHKYGDKTTLLDGEATDFVKRIGFHKEQGIYVFRRKHR